MQQCFRVMYSLCINNDPFLEKLLQLLESNPSWGDRLLVQQLLEHCLMNGVLEHVDILMNTIESLGMLWVEMQRLALGLRLKALFNWIEASRRLKNMNPICSWAMAERMHCGQMFSTCPSANKLSEM